MNHVVKFRGSLGNQNALRLFLPSGQMSCCMEMIVAMSIKSEQVTTAPDMAIILVMSIYVFFHFIFFIHSNPVGKGPFSGGRDKNLKSKIYK